MAMLSSPAFGPKASLLYITVGAMMDVWTAVYYFVKVRGANEPLSGNTSFWLLGLFLTGLTLLIIGVLLGQIGQAARRAELTPSETVRAEANIQKVDAASPAVAPAAGIAPPGVAPGYYPPGVAQVPAPAPVAPPAPAAVPH